MNTINEIGDAAGAQRRGCRTRVLPIAADLALAPASATAHAQTKPTVACTSLQKAGESVGATVVTAQKAAAATPCKSWPHRPRDWRHCERGRPCLQAGDRHHIRQQPASPQPSVVRKHVA